MKIRSTVHFAEPPESVWPLLCESRMDTRRCAPFRLGVPKPVACRLPSGRGHEGAERQCVSERGVIRQRILEWSPPHRLRFAMESVEPNFLPGVTDLQETFTLEATGTGTRLTRTTRLHARGRAACFKAALMSVGLKFVHLYVFRNWRRTLRASSPG